MHLRPSVLILAAVFAALHAAGVLFATPIVGPAEILTIALLILYAFLTAPEALRRALPMALIFPLADAVRTVPAVPNYGGYRYIFVPQFGPQEIDLTRDLTPVFAATWAGLGFAALLVIAMRRTGLSRVVALCGGLLIGGYVVFRVVAAILSARAEADRFVGGTWAAAQAIVLTALPCLGLGLTAIALAAVLAARGHRLATAGAVLLAVTALPHLDAAFLMWSLAAPGVFHSTAIVSSAALPDPVPALVAACELTAYILIVAGLRRRA